MDSSLSAIKAQLDMHTRWFNNVLLDISEQESHSRNDQRLNHIKWVAGHLLNTRLTSMSKIAGLPVDETYKDLFARGAALVATDAYPPLDELIDRWKSAGAAIAEAMLSVPGEILATKTPAQLPINEYTIRGTLFFLLSHEAFHIGQLSVLRKMVGKEAMSYG